MFTFLHLTCRSFFIQSEFQMLLALWCVLLRHRSISQAVSNYINALGELSMNRVATITYEPVAVRPLYVTWQINSLTFEETKADFESLLAIIEANNPDIASIALQMEAAASNEFKAAAILEQVAELAASRPTFSKYTRSMVISGRYLATIVFADSSRKPEFSYRNVASINRSQMIGVALSGSDRKVGFLNSNFEGVENVAANVATEITNTINGLGLSLPVGGTENKPSNTSEFAVILWGGDFKLNIDSERVKATDTQKLYDVEWMAENRKELDPMSMSFTQYWPTNCFEDDTKRVPSYGYKDGSLAVVYVPAWHSHIIVYENVLEKPRKTIEYSVADGINTGVDKPVLAMYDFEI